MYAPDFLLNLYSAAAVQPKSLVIYINLWFIFYRTLFMLYFCVVAFALIFVMTYNTLIFNDIVIMTVARPGCRCMCGKLHRYAAHLSRLLLPCNEPNYQLTTTTHTVICFNVIFVPCCKLQKQLLLFIKIKKMAPSLHEAIMHNLQKEIWNVWKIVYENKTKKRNYFAVESWWIHAFATFPNLLALYHEMIHKF